MSFNITKTPIQLFSKRLTHIKYSQLIIKDLERLNNLRKLNEKKRYLLQSYIINLVSSWQVFIEELLEYGFNKKWENNTMMIKTFKNKKGSFNTPDIKNIDKIFKRVLDIKKITDALIVPEMDLKDVKGKVNKLLMIRHKIVHTGKSKELLDLKNNFDFMRHLMIVGEKLELKVNKELGK